MLQLINVDTQTINVLLVAIALAVIAWVLYLKARGWDLAKALHVVSLVFQSAGDAYRHFITLMIEGMQEVDKEAREFNKSREWLYRQAFLEYVHGIPYTQYTVPVIESADTQTPLCKYCKQPSTRILIEGESDNMIEYVCVNVTCRTQEAQCRIA